jgi:lysophospholipase L1-like esterase
MIFHIALLSAGILFFLAGLCILWVWVMKGLPARGNLKYYIRREKPSCKKRVVFLGDSITEARLSADYVAMLRKSFDSSRWEFVNGGIGGDTSYNALSRVDEVIGCKPDMVFILIGVNDVNAALLPENAEWYMWRKKLPEAPSIDNFNRDLGKTVAMLKEAGVAKIALFSLPPVGEDPLSEEFRLTAEFSGIIRQIAEENRAGYIPLNEEMSRIIEKEKPCPEIEYSEWEKSIYRAAFYRYLFGRSYDYIGKRNGFIFHGDYLHINERGASLIAEMACAYLER